ncbi:response regulator transcription factor [Mesorhizobium sp.]|uniref:LuxR C-terminal-related transcriptional regulator n=1 Tax=Mesorhizobium sp. TaxID=1871066 RepID=UPI00258D8DCA|nr:response regulator transcription factor [Mesorhizobium sp.]
MHQERIILADDHPVFRKGLRLLIQRIAPGAETIEANSIPELLSLARTGQAPTTFIIDMMFSDVSIEPRLATLREEFQRASIIIVSMIEDPEVADRIMSYGVDGFISKSVAPSELLAAIAAIRDGDLVVKLESSGAPVASPPVTGLTQRQYDVLQLLAKGKSNKEIAAELNISPFTVRVHVSSLLKVLGVTSRTAAAAKAAGDLLLP